MSIDIKDMIPRQGFIPDYVKWARTQTDAPAIFHVAGALAAASPVLSPWVMLEQPPDFRAVPIHLWLLLVAESGDRKTTARQMAVRVIQGLDEGRTLGGGVKIVPDYPRVIGLPKSPEAMFDRLSKVPHSHFLVVGDLQQELRKPGWRGDGLGFLCEMYDACQDEYRRVLVGKRTSNGFSSPVEITVKQPGVNILAEAVPYQIGESDWQGGFFERMLVVYGRLCRVNPMEHPRDDEVPVSVLRKLDRTPVRRLVSVQRKAMAVFKHLQVTPTRLAQQVLRVATIYAITSGGKEIDADTMQRAMAFGEYCRLSRDYVLAGLELGVLG